MLTIPATFYFHFKSLQNITASIAKNATNTIESGQFIFNPLLSSNSLRTQCGRGNTHTHQHPGTGTTHHRKPTCRTPQPAGAGTSGTQLPADSAGDARCKFRLLFLDMVSKRQISIKWLIIKNTIFYLELFLFLKFVIQYPMPLAVLLQ